jgi:SSS family solute:Na+ symporter
LNRDTLTPGTFFYTIGHTNFLTFAAWFFLFCVIVCVGVSLFTRPPSYERIKGLTFDTLTPEQKATNRNTYNAWDVIASVAVIAIVIYVMTTFTG